MEPLDIWGRPEKSTPHRFEWALKILRDGGRVRRAKWAAGFYIHVNENNILVSESEPTALRPRVARYDLEWSEMCAADWQRVK